MDFFDEDKPKSFQLTWAGFRNRLYRYRILLKKRWWLLLLTMSLGLGAMSWWHSVQPPLVASAARLMVSGKLAIPEGSSFSEDGSNFYGTQVELMKSEEVRSRAQARVATLHPDIKGSAKLTVTQPRNTSIFILEAVGEDPVFVRAFLDAVVEEYIAGRREFRSEKSDTTLSAITDELMRVEKELRAGEEELVAFQKTNNIGFLEQEGNSAASYLASLNRKIADLRTEYDLLKLLDVDQMIERGRKEDQKEGGTATDAQPNLVRSFGPESEYLRAKQQIEVLKAQRDEFSKVLRPAHPTIIQLNEDIAKYETLIATFRTQSMEQVETRRASIALQIQNLEKVAAEWQTKAQDLGQRLAEYGRIKSKVDRTKGVYERLLTSLRNVDVTKRIDQETISLLSKASAPISVRWGKLAILLIGLGGGALIGLFILALMDLIDDRMTSFAEYQNAFSEPVLAQIAREKTRGEIPHVEAHDERHGFAESFRSLRSSIHYLPNKGTPVKSILVTSSVPNEGKTTIALNLAVTMAFTQARVLLIDADVRRGSLHETFEVKNDRGLGEVLRGEASAADCIKPTAIGGLSLLPRGTSRGHPGERFVSGAVDELLAELSRDFDYIILDTAPVMVADDTASLAPKVDACVYVVRFSFTSSRLSRRALDTLKNRGTNVIGIVCNDVHSAMPEYHYYYTYSEYYGAKDRAKT